MERHATKQDVNQRLFSRNYTRFGFDLNPVVFLAASAFVLLFSAYALLDAERAFEMFTSLRANITESFDWLFIMGSNFYILVCLYLALSQLGSVRIGGVDSRPEFSNLAWYSMLLSAGMGIGLMFWAVGEPLYHFVQTPPIFTGADGIHAALAATFFHWGFHPWAIYALLALSLAFFAYNQKLPLSLRSAFYPLLKDRIYGIPGDLIDTFAVLATLFGLATSLGLGIQQINSGLHHMLGIEFSVAAQVVLIAGITMLAIVSVLSGIDKGIRILSQVNIKLAGLFMVLILLLGPTLYLLRLFSNALGVYLNQFVESALYVSQNGNGWQGEWSVFYLAWWISWSPFVGTFIARISRGRTIREFVLGVLVIPSLLSFVWLSVFGGTAIFMDQRLDGGLFAVVEGNLPGALFELIDSLTLPFLAGVLSNLLFVVVIALVMSYFITSSDSGSLVIDKITSGGKHNAPKQQRVFWAVIEGLIAAVLLVIGGEEALEALQAAVVSTGLPLSVLLIVMSISLVQGIQAEHQVQRQIRESQRLTTILQRQGRLEEDEHDL